MGIQLTRKHLALTSLLAIGGVSLPAFFGSTNDTAKAQVKPPQCFRIAQGESPMSDELSTPQTETWCYRQLEEPQGARLIYQVDKKGETRPELSVMIEADGTLRHASLLKGKLTIHRIRADFNPIGVPLNPPPDAELVPAPITTSSVESIEKGLGLFQEYGDVNVHMATMSTGSFAASVEPTTLPWRGYWFPHTSGRMHNGENSPLAKFDRFIQRRAQVNPGAQKWEKGNHNNTGLAWAGHCHGWAATSTLREEPKKPVTDPYTGITFSVSDLKGLWIEHDTCPKIAFYGGRNRGRPTDNPSDINPVEFHNVITYFIGQLKKPVLMDYMASVPVDNSVISGYEMEVKQTAPNTYFVEMMAKVHHYDKELIDKPGIAPPKNTRYAYYIYTDENGTAKSGSWVTSNPDFLWSALSPSTCDGSNPVVEEFWINELMRFMK